MDPLHAMYILILIIARASSGKRLDYKATDKREHFDYDPHITLVSTRCENKRIEGAALLVI